MDLLFPRRRLRCQEWGGRVRRGWCSPFWELNALQPFCSWPLLPPSSSSPMISAGTGHQETPAASPLPLPSFYSRCTLPPRGKGRDTIYLTLDHSLSSHGDDSLGSLGNGAPVLLSGNSQIPSSPNCMYHLRPSGSIWAAERLRPRVGQGKSEIIQAKQLSGTQCWALGAPGRNSNSWSPAWPGGQVGHWVSGQQEGLIQIC